MPAVWGAHAMGGMGWAKWYHMTRERVGPVVRGQRSARIWQEGRTRSAWWF